MTDSFHADVTGAIAGALLAFVMWLLPECEAPERDPHEEGFIGSPLRKWPGEPAVVFPADGCWFGGEKWETRVARTEPNS